MKYPYQDLSPGQFETLVVAICQFLLGSATQRFATGPDGGRDAKFIGTAELHPSAADPWKGTVIVQAKHTNGYNRSFSDADFYSTGNAATVLGGELPRIKRLRGSKDLDHYMLFSNRKLSGNAEKKLRDVIAAACGLPHSSVFLCGVEQLELWLKRFPDAARMAEIDPVDSPLIVSPDELADVVERLAVNVKAVGAALPTERVSYERKNKLNNVTDEYARELQRKYLKYAAEIKAFLASPENDDILARYTSAAEEFRLGVVAKRKDYQTFDEVLTYLIRLLLDRDPILRRHASLTRAIVFYMYWNCDVGQTDDVAP